MRIKIVTTITTVLLLTGISLTSCNQSEAKKEEMQQLSAHLSTMQSEKNTMKNTLTDLANQKAVLENEIAVLNQDVRVKKMYAQGKSPRYILKLKLRQSHFTLDIGEHLKDAMNEITFEMPVDKEFYDKVSEGTRIVDEFRSGSFIMNGSFGDWRMTVDGKEIR